MSESEAIDPGVKPILSFSVALLLYDSTRGFDPNLYDHDTVMAAIHMRVSGQIRNMRDMSSNDQYPETLRHDIKEAVGFWESVLSEVEESARLFNERYIKAKTAS